MLCSKVNLVKPLSSMKKFYKEEIISMADYIMAIDQGTTSTRAIIFDKEGQPQWSFQKRNRTILP